jgi:hypothetical protein
MYEILGCTKESAKNLYQAIGSNFGEFQSFWIVTKFHEFNVVVRENIWKF